jgi:hypothetical protein
MKLNLILASLVVLLALPIWLTLRGERLSFTDLEDLPRLFEGFNSERVAYLRLSRARKDVPPPEAQPGQPAPELPRDELVIQRDGTERWVLRSGELAGVPVRTQRVEADLLDHLAKIRRDDKAVVKAEPSDADLKELELTKEDGLLVQAFRADQTPVAELIVGKDAAEGKWGGDVVRGRYVRAANSKSILVYEVDFWNLALDRDQWIDTKVHELKEEQIVGFGYKNAKGAVSFKKDAPSDATWKADQAPENVGAVRQGEVTNLLSRVRFLSAQRFVSPLQGVKLAERGLEPPRYELTITLEGGAKHTVRIGDKIGDKNEFYAVADSVPNFLLALGDWIVTPFDKDPKDLFDPPADALRPGEGKQGNGK